MTGAFYVLILLIGSKVLAIYYQASNIHLRLKFSLACKDLQVVVRIFSVMINSQTHFHRRLL